MREFVKFKIRFGKVNLNFQAIEHGQIHLLRGLMHHATCHSALYIAKPRAGILEFLINGTTRVL